MFTSILVLLSIEYAGVLIAILADLVSGLRKAKFRGEKCTSWGLRRSVDKLVRYFLALISLSIVDFMAMAAIVALHQSGTLSIPVFPFLTTFGALALALIEVKSICEKSEEKDDFRNAAKLFAEIVSYLTKKKRIINN